VLTVIDIFSKRAFARPLLRKTGEEVRRALDSIWRQDRPSPPTAASARITMGTDAGKEFLNAPVQRWFRERGIHHFTLQGDHKAAIIERFQRTLRERLHRAMTASGETYKYLRLLPKVISAYNDTPHSSILQVKPNDVNRSNELQLLSNQYRNLTSRRSVTRGPRDDLNEGDTVKISKSKQLYDKGYRGYWSDEPFIIASVHQGVPNKAYVLKDADGETVQGAFYREQLQPVSA